MKNVKNWKYNIGAQLKIENFVFDRLKNWARLKFEMLKIENAQIGIALFQGRNLLSLQKPNSCAIFREVSKKHLRYFFLSSRYFEEKNSESLKKYCKSSIKTPYS